MSCLAGSWLRTQQRGRGNVATTGCRFPKSQTPPEVRGRAQSAAPAGFGASFWSSDEKLDETLPVTADNEAMFPKYLRLGSFEV